MDPFICVLGVLHIIYHFWLFLTNLVSVPYRQSGNAVLGKKFQQGLFIGDAEYIMDSLSS